MYKDAVLILSEIIYYVQEQELKYSSICYLSLQFGKLRSRKVINRIVCRSMKQNIFNRTEKNPILDF